MKHARDDYNRIQDPAAVPGLRDAYEGAQLLRAELLGESLDDVTSARLFERLSSLVFALAPLMSPVADGCNPIAEDEPVFILRARDINAPATLEAWAKATYARGAGNPEMARLAMDQAERFREWQRMHGAKLPDLPHQPQNVALVPRADHVDMATLAARAEIMDERPARALGTANPADPTPRLTLNGVDVPVGERFSAPAVELPTTLPQNRAAGREPQS